MELINQHTKKIMEGCKERAKDVGLTFECETLEYIVTNKDLIKLSPKYMIPTIYDYWVHDVEILKGEGQYELYPSNPYETVINTRPAISFYNDNNPDWLNVMIFYHVLGHIDFFQNNVNFSHTWDYDFNGQALSDKMLIEKLRSSKGRWVDYVIEFARGIDNCVGYFQNLTSVNTPVKTPEEEKFDFYFNIFIQEEEKVDSQEYIKEIQRFNECKKANPDKPYEEFFAEVNKKYPEFSNVFEKNIERRIPHGQDLMEYILENSPFLNKHENLWMKQVVEIIRNTSLFFQPQIRTKTMNEGWASYWHEKLFLMDERIKGHEIDFAKTHSAVTSIPKVGLNPYALGLRLFQYIEEYVDQGRYSMDFIRTLDMQKRKDYDTKSGEGNNFIFNVRQYFNDFTFIKEFINQDFVDRHKLFVTDRRLNKERMTWEYYIKSKKAEDYQQMMYDSLYHPPHIEFRNVTDTNILKLNHVFEGKPLVTDFISNTLLGIEYLWGGPVELETREPILNDNSYGNNGQQEENIMKNIKWQKVLYRMEKRKLTRKAH